LRQGDTYQVNYTVQLKQDLSANPFAIYNRMVVEQEAGYNAYVEHDEMAVISMSPELFFEQNDRELTTRPMKGTTQRGVTDQEDLAQASWLEQDPKNRSENMMIVDLLRNDMNRISEVGSEHVERLCQVEQYSTVWQMTSTIKSQLRPDVDLVEIFRSLFPLLNLVYPSMNEKMQAGLVNAYKESGFLPEWASPGHRDCMVGNNSASVVADAYIKGLRGYDIETLWEAVVHGANAVHPTVSSTGRKGFDYYNRLGYVPYNVGINESVARTLEYAYDDWCIYQLGLKLGKSAKELKPFKLRAMNYQKVFDKETGLMRGRNEDGSFQSPFNPFKWGDAFTEGNSWHYTWSVFHDPAGLAKLIGGYDKFNAMLDSVFQLPPIFDDSYYGFTIHEIREMQIMNMGNYAHGNQPIQHMIYLYDYSGQPWKAQYWVREVMDRLYTAQPDGYCGDEDNGQTSAWYVFSALGFYPVCPGTTQYVIGSPYFKKMQLHLENGNTITLNAPKNSEENRFINSISINGAPYSKTFFNHSDLLKGCNIVYNMSKEPNKQRGINEKDTPYSFTDELKK